METIRTKHSSSLGRSRSGLFLLFIWPECWISLHCAQDLKYSWLINKLLWLSERERQTATEPWQKICRASAKWANSTFVWSCFASYITFSCGWIDKNPSYLFRIIRSSYFGSKCIIFMMNGLFENVSTTWKTQPGPRTLSWVLPSDFILSVCCCFCFGLGFFLTHYHFWWCSL